MTGYTPTDLRNLAVGLANRVGKAPERLRDSVGGNSKWEGTYTFELRDAETGALDRRVEKNQTVDEGENSLLQMMAGYTDNATQTFSGDGSTTTFQLNYPRFPVKTINSVTVGGTAQSAPADYAMDYYDGSITFSSAPASGTDNISVDVDYYAHPWDWVAVGTDGTAVSESDTSLGSEDTRIALDSGYYKADESAVEVTGQWTFGQNEANISIAEAGLFNAPASAGVNGSMLSRTVVSPTIDKSSSQNLIVQWALSMN